MSRVIIEALEGRCLFTVPAGFEDVQLHNLSTSVASSMEFAPDGRLFIADSARGQIRVVKNGTLLSTPALTLTVDHYGERGIQSLAFDPHFATNKHLYIYYTKPDPANPNNGPSNAVNRLVRYTMNATSADTINAASARVLLDNIPSPSGFHNGGALHFGADGMLYLGVGDGARSATAQDLNSLNGKVLRLNVNDGQPLIPADNPFAGHSGKRGEVWAYGLRNPFTGNFKPGTNTLFINDVGQNTWEEINDIAKGKNYGWPLAEGNSTNPAFTNPIYSYMLTADNRAAISGGAFYTGVQFPSSYVGKYFFGDYVRRTIRVLDPATKTASDFGSNLTNVVDLDVAPDGTLFTLGVGGEVRRIRYTAGANRAPTAVASANPTSGVAPLTVNFTGAGSSDPDADALTYRWTFGDGTFASGRDVSHTYTTNGTYAAKLTVTDGRGGSDDSSNLSIVVGNRAPTATITAPASGSLYSGGQTISFAGAGTDPEDGTLPAASFTWSIVFHHAGHTHPFRTSIPGVTGGTFAIPRTGEFDANQFYRIHLTVKDSAGLTHSTFRDIKPRTTTLTLASNITGAQLTLDGSPVVAPTSILGVEGMTRSIGAPTQTLNGKTYEFVSWSDGGAATHNIDTPLNDTTYTATFREVPTSGLSLRATADAYVQGGTSAATNFGNATALIVKLSSQPQYLRETYLKFDISSAASIGTAKLRLVGKLADTRATNVPVSIFAVSGTGWSETGITFNNRPAAGATALASRTIIDATTRTYEWDLTNYVKAEKAAGRNVVGFVLRAGRSVHPVVTFASDEAASNEPALLITPTATGTTLGATHDTYVHSGSPTTNFGNATQLQVKRSSSGFARETYLKFDLSSVSTINAAKLRLFGGLSQSWGSAIQTAAYGSSNTTWTETGITYNNRPASGATALAIVSISGTTQKYHEWDLTSYLKSEKAAGRNLVTIVLKNLQSGDPFTIFNSSEAATNKPQLVMT